MRCSVARPMVPWHPGALTTYVLVSKNGCTIMARNARIPETYRRRLRLSRRDVAVAAGVTLLAGALVITALWKTPAQGVRFPEAAVHTYP
jgi:hypothetical protein